MREAERKAREQAEWRERERKWKGEWESMGGSNQRAIEHVMRSRMDERLDEIEKKVDGMLDDRFSQLEQKMTEQIETNRKTDKVNTELDIRDLERDVAHAMTTVETDLHSRLGELEHDLSGVRDMRRPGLGVQDIEKTVAETTLKVLIRLGIARVDSAGNIDMRHPELDIENATGKGTTEEEAPAEGTGLTKSRKKKKKR